MDKYIEVVYDDVSHRKGNIVNVKDFTPVKVNRVVYTTMYNYSDSILNYIEIAKTKFGHPTVKQYDGELFISYLWIDIDNKDLSNSVNMCRAVIEKLNMKYNLDYESMVIYFSGGKGFHVGLHSSIFGASDFSSKQVNSIVRYMIEDIMEEKSKLVDWRIYDTTRVFRAPFSKHNTTDYYKVDIDYNLILENNLEQILKLAKECKRVIPHKYKFTYNELLTKTFKDAIDKVKNEKDNVEISVNKEDLKDNETIFKVPALGQRNYDMFRMAFRLFSGTELKNNEVTDIMKFIYYEVNAIASKNGDEGISHQDFKALIKSAYQRTRSLKKSIVNAESISSISGRVFNAIKNSKYVTTVIPSWNKDLRGGWVVQNLYSIIGRQGTIKSIYCQEVAIQNALTDVDALYINSEMSDIALFDRIYLRMYGLSFIRLIQEGKINDSDIPEIELKLHETFKNRLQTVSQVDLEAKDIGEIVDRKQDETKRKIQLVVIDSMNSMKLHGESEALTAFQNTKYLKQVCKDKQFAGLLINHATNSLDFESRDAAGHVRGGAKVLDNCDAYASFSKIIDKENSNFKVKPADVVYKSSRFYFRLVNKRDTGNTINKIVQVSDTLELDLLDIEPNTEEYYG